MYELDEDLCNTLVMGYDAPLRFKIAKEWRLMKEGKANVPVNPYEHFEETDWIELALEKTRENKRLVELHVRKAIDTHSLSRLLGEKRGSTKVQMILKGLCAAGVLERRLDDSGKPKQEITRLFNLHHATKIDAVQLAAKALGKELSLVMV